MGCTSVMILPEMSPLMATPRPATSRIVAPTRVLRRKVSLIAPSLRCMLHSETPTTNAPPVRYADRTTCGNVTSWTLLSSTAKKSLSSARPVFGL